MTVVDAMKGLPNQPSLQLRGLEMVQNLTEEAGGSRLLDELHGAWQWLWIVWRFAASVTTATAIIMIVNVKKIANEKEILGFTKTKPAIFGAAWTRMTRILDERTTSGIRVKDVVATMNLKHGGR